MLEEAVIAIDDRHVIKLSSGVIIIEGTAAGGCIVLRPTRATYAALVAALKETTPSR